MVFCQRQGLFYCCCNFYIINAGFFSLASVHVKAVDMINVGSAYNYYFQLQITESNSSVKGSVLPHVIRYREETCWGNNETWYIHICQQGSLVSFLYVLQLLLTYTYSMSWSRVHHVKVHPSGKRVFLIIYISNLIKELWLAFMTFGSCTIFQDKLLWTGGRDTMAGPAWVKVISSYLWDLGWGRGTAAAAAKSRQSCLTLCDPLDSSPPGSRPWDSPGKNSPGKWSGLPLPSLVEVLERQNQQISTLPVDLLSSPDYTELLRSSSQQGPQNRTFPPRGATATPSHGGEGMCSYGERKSRVKEMGGPGAEHTGETPKGLWKK